MAIVLNISYSNALPSPSAVAPGIDVQVNPMLDAVGCTVDSVKIQLDPDITA